MLGRDDVTMYLLAVKSLMSFDPNLAIVVHSDGSLTQRNVDRISDHISGVRFVRYDEAEERARTALSGPLLPVWRTKDAAYRRLIDIELWRRREKVIILDSDVLAIREPVEVFDWAAAGTRPFLLGQTPSGSSAQEIIEGSHVQQRFVHSLPEISERTGSSVRFLQGTTAGFCGYRDEISLRSIEQALQASLEVGLPMEQWGGDQCLIIYLLSVAGAERLPQNQYLNFEPKLKPLVDRAVMLHFYGTHRFHAGIYPRLAADAVRRLRRAERRAKRDATRS
jgi:hypothetical protein